MCSPCSRSPPPRIPSRVGARVVLLNIVRPVITRVCVARLRAGASAERLGEAVERAHARALDRVLALFVDLVGLAPARLPAFFGVIGQVADVAVDGVVGGDVRRGFVVDDFVLGRGHRGRQGDEDGAHGVGTCERGGECWRRTAMRNCLDLLSFPDAPKPRFFCGGM